MIDYLVAEELQTGQRPQEEKKYPEIFASKWA